MQEKPDKVPHYASFMALILSYEDNEYYIQALYNSLDPFDLELCPKEDRKNKKCKFDSFAKNAEKYTIEDAQSACIPDDPNEYTMSASLMFLVGSMILMLGVAVALLIYKKRYDIKNMFSSLKDTSNSNLTEMDEIDDELLPNDEKE